MNHLHWMKLYIGDELSNTSHMTPAEFGSYMLLKMHYWRFGCLPTDDERLARIAKVSPEQWREVMPAIGPLFEEDWRSQKLEEQRAEAEEKHQKRVEAGKKGGRPRRDEKQSYKHSFSDEKAKPKQPEPEPEPEPYSNSDLEPAPEPEFRAYDKGRTFSHELTTCFPKPESVEAGSRFLVSRGCPPEEMKRCLGMLMSGNLAPFDIEAWDIRARVSA
ncbi:DUF1376 domain-containing protein [Sinorhizobium meliloti]|uniref:YdaU family protein n=1 Tax=Rhizobium meliloti TaxID=382 RepID=UPI002380C295|nr:DUF1376 domain-containing protein [Sinorhizobium meliloti]MDE3796626.1 DUF1376 domain-containing protein [Sinorhizobium meliloti]